MSTIEVYVLKPFKYSTNGYTEKSADLYETIPDFPEGFFEGLNKAGYIRRAKIGDGKISLKPSAEELSGTSEADTTSVETDNPTDTIASSENESVVEWSGVDIPDDWKELKFFALRSLAAKLSETPVKTMADAVAVIEAELANRVQG